MRSAELPVRLAVHVVKLPFRKRDYSCLTRLTYKYFVEPERIAEIWRLLEAELGPIQRIEPMRVQQISSPALIVRSTFDGNPITVMQRSIEPGALDRVHAIFGFTEEPAP
jgi:hypothetical protein